MKTADVMVTLASVGANETVISCFEPDLIMPVSGKKWVRGRHEQIHRAQMSLSREKMKVKTYQSLG